MSGGGGVRWQQLFADLEALFEHEEAALERGESASRARAEIGAVELAQRLRGAVGTALSLRCRGADRIDGVLVEVGPDWLLVEDERGASSLVATRAVSTVGGLGRRTAALAEDGVVRARLDFRRALRGLARDRTAVRVVLDDGGVLVGTLDRVGADYVELAEHPADEPRRAEAVRGVVAVVIDTIAVVRTATPGIG